MKTRPSLKFGYEWELERLSMRLGTQAHKAYAHHRNMLQIEAIRANNALVSLYHQALRELQDYSK